jgi:hypothetical protein
MVIQLDPNELFIDYQYAKITCGQQIKEKKGLSRFFVGRSIPEILAIGFDEINAALKPETEEDQFVLYLEWDALRAALALYLGVENDSIDIDRCAITSIEHTPEGIEVAEVILPPKELPKILPCSLANQHKDSRP